jgi:hypothetical protein
MPWLLDLSKSVGSLASKAAGVLIRGEKPDDSEKEAEKHLENELFSEGCEVTDEVDAKEVAELSAFLPKTEDMTVAALDAAPSVSAPAPAPPMLKRQASYAGVALPDLVARFANRMNGRTVCVFSLCVDMLLTLCSL